MFVRRAQHKLWTNVLVQQWHLDLSLALLAAPLDVATMPERVQLQWAGMLAEHLRIDFKNILNKMIL